MYTCVTMQSMAKLPWRGLRPRASTTVRCRLERCSSLECLAMILAAMPSCPIASACHHIATVSTLAHCWNTLPLTWKAQSRQYKDTICTHRVQRYQAAELMQARLYNKVERACRRLMEVAGLPAVHQVMAVSPVYAADF